MTEQSIAALKEAARKSSITIFDQAFNVRLHQTFETADLGQTVAEVLVHTASALIESNADVFSEVLDAYGRQDETTSKYSDITRKALDLLIDQQNKVGGE